MKKTLLFLVCICLVEIAKTQPKLPYGEMTGVQWQDFEKNASEWLNSLQNSSGQPIPHDEGTSRTLASEYKTIFVLGIVELGVTLPADLYYGHGPADNRLYSPKGDLVPFLRDVSPYQLAVGLDKFYEDYRNTNVKILEALIVVRKEVTGKSQEEIEWWTRYYRADWQTRINMRKEHAPR